MSNEVEELNEPTTNANTNDEINASEPSPLDMSDDEFSAYLDSLSTTGVETPVASSEAEGGSTPSNEEEEDEDDDEGVEEDEGESNESEESEIFSEGDGDTTEETDSVDTEDKPEPKVKVPKELKKFGDVNKLFEPFKANGKMVSVNSADEALTLMKMGANYVKKMTAIKPNLRIIKMLSNHDLLDESKLSYLIDLSKGNEGAIKKLLKDNNTNPLDIDIDEEVNYNPSSTYTVNDKEVELDQTLDDIRDTASYKETLNIISNKWDKASRAVLLDNPQFIPIINDHVNSGIYQKVMDIVDRERMLGRLNDLSDLEAYKKVGDAINANGGFKANSKQTSSVSKTARKDVDPKLKDRKRAASSTKASPTQHKTNFNPLDMSDDEFEKLDIRKFI